MSNQDKINKVLKALAEGTKSVRQNPSEQNYQKALLEIEKAGKQSNFWITIIAFTFIGVGFWLIMSHFSQPPKKSTPIYTFTFPLKYCGDTTSGGTNTWHPVYVDYSEASLNNIQKNYCCDATYDSTVDLILVASFHNKSKAEQLVKDLKKHNFKNARLGNGLVVTTNRGDQGKNCNK